MYLSCRSCVPHLCGKVPLSTKRCKFCAALAVGQALQQPSRFLVCDHIHIDGIPSEWKKVFQNSNKILSTKATKGTLNVTKLAPAESFPVLP